MMHAYCQLLKALVEPVIINSSTTTSEIDAFISFTADAMVTKINSTRLGTAGESVAIMAIMNREISDKYI